ncbi:MJ1255/VC2487 family glycosyltransferase [Pseudoalteromonas sp. Cnat2-41]|uniref:MJ1255/VC2487 family glycosyltransferase n=1 Tax=unclassified Pseudoalteromonas TaxID=194690 RepID=UPI001EF97698|nr:MULTISPECIES: MJ1255/VC2487 family glycosyltransferase [unclassified Pseudoalteromonas]MCF2861943.1 glycosyltransferase [Pseudoalteromonas sp. CNAT2-18]MCG7559684.1 glycosyltransferase [Pseudoalteromonas sp. CNAT2-18.1]
MRILYGVQGTGNGHTTRARVMAKAFAKAGIEVDYLFSGRSKADYFDMQEFADFQTRTGLTFVTERGRVNGFKTVKQAKIREFISDIRELNLRHYDLIFNDFEPVTAWAGRRQKIPVIGMSHQAAFLSPHVPVTGDNLFTKAMIRNFAPADVYLGVHWQPFDDSIIPPFIEHGTAVDSEYVDNKVLVYLPFEELEEVIHYLKDFPGKEFYCYHPHAQDQSLAHIHLRRPSRANFLRDLASASGVIANAGFELASEALTLGKKLLLKPLNGQFEQYSNALTLQQMQRAQVMHYLDQDALEDWVNIATHSRINYPQDPAPLVDWLVQGRWHQRKGLNEQLWHNVL